MLLLTIKEQKTILEYFLLPGLEVHKLVLIKVKKCTFLCDKDLACDIGPI